MIKGYKIITLCGSTKFKNEFIEVQKNLTLKGNIVISVGLFGHSGDNEVWNENTKEMLDDMHKRKIDLADEIFVINKNGYIGSSTKSEIEYAIKTGKKVNYMETDFQLNKEKDNTNEETIDIKKFVDEIMFNDDFPEFVEAFFNYFDKDK